MYKDYKRGKESEGGWTVLNTCLSLKSELIIGLGLSPGTIVEIAYTKYHKKYLNKNVRIFLDKRTISKRLNPEIEEEINLKYFNSEKELDKLLIK